LAASDFSDDDDVCTVHGHLTATVRQPSATVAASDQKTLQKGKASGAIRMLQKGLNAKAKHVVVNF